MQHALSDVNTWRNNGVNGLRVAVNVSSRQFRGAGLVDSVIQILNRTNVPPHLLELEITEGILLEDFPETTEVFERLADLGVGFAVDDFGTGYSSLNYLRRFPVGCLKIDRTFISGVVSNPDQAALVQAIINMARSLKLEVISEGRRNGRTARLRPGERMQSRAGFPDQQTASGRRVLQTGQGLGRKAFSTRTVSEVARIVGRGTFRHALPLRSQ